MRRIPFPATLSALICGVAAAASPAMAADSAGFRPEALVRYNSAVAQVQSRQFPEAIAGLNELARDYPRVAEVFASRCSAQLGQGSNAGAEADCAYAVALKPGLSSAVYGLAVAEDNQGKSPKALEHYRTYAALPDASAPLKAQALARVNALAAPEPLLVPPPPPPAVASAPATAVPSNGPRGSLYIYRNHLMQHGDQQITLLVDDHVVGDIAHDQYVEVQLPAGDHTVEACIGGIRYRRSSGLPFLQIHSSDGHIEASLGNTDEHRERLVGLTVPIEVLPNGRSYVNFDHSGGQLLLQQMPPEQAEREIHDDCRKAYTKKL
jgi:hypothetical protein